MKLAMNMIRQYADIPVTPEEYTQRMIMTGTAVEGTEDISGGMEKVVVGRVLTCEDVEGTHLHECTVDVGGPETLHIVCGAPNVAAGQLVPVALDGAHLPGGVKIKRGKLRGGRVKCRNVAPPVYTIEGKFIAGKAASLPSLQIVLGAGVDLHHQLGEIVAELAEAWS